MGVIILVRHYVSRLLTKGLYITPTLVVAMSKTELFKWKCPDCGKEIVSMYKAQFDTNSRAHYLSCNKKKESGTNARNGQDSEVQ